jgi:hypothetical protein
MACGVAEKKTCRVFITANIKLIMHNIKEMHTKYESEFLVSIDLLGDIGVNHRIILK